MKKTAGKLLSILLVLFFAGHLKAESQSLRNIQEGNSNAKKEHIKKRAEYILSPFKQAQACYRINDTLDIIYDVSPYICKKKGVNSLFIVYGKEPPWGYYYGSYIRGALYGDNGFSFRNTYDDEVIAMSSSIKYNGGNIFYVKWGLEREYVGGDRLDQHETPVFECHFDNMTCYSKTRQPKKLSSVQFREIVNNLKP